MEDPQCFARPTGRVSEISWEVNSGAPVLAGCARRGEFDFLSRTKRDRPGQGLLADAELGDDALVALGIVFLEVVEQATPLADQHEKTAARAMVLLVRLEVLRQLSNALAQ